MKKTKFLNLASAACCQFHKHSTHVIYSHSKISLADVNYMHAPMQCFQNASAYFVTALSYRCKMFMKSTPVFLNWTIEKRLKTKKYINCIKIVSLSAS